MPHIRDIRLEFPAGYPGNTSLSEDWAQFKQILSLKLPRGLQGIVLDIERFLNPSVVLKEHNFPEIIESLTALTQLRHLRITPERPTVSFPGLSVTDYRKMAKAFPGLEHLTLPECSMITFEALYKVALLCPRLQSLTMGIDTQALPDLPGSQYPAIATNLQVLSVGNSPLNNIHSVTRHLNQLFPQLTTIITTNTAWNTVQDLLKLYRSMVADSSHRREVTPALIEELGAGHEADLSSVVTGTTT
ncbi:hypothetical protein BDN72DRAFT_247262 [Pluteus cervinus]|uniref:Uncharacterized protein n=1 Tax=Pluteus cervinus TaxID=181527 RepID=A0ACD3B5P0_9AGAR|nr:hypothetical protein BDN72DRAFT_247262 [Pluteus cervinus]